MYKISILSSMAFHKKVDVDKIYREGITQITPEDIEYGRELGFAIRLLAIAKKRNNTIEVRVHPTFIPLDHPLAAVRHSFNAVFLKGDAVGYNAVRQRSRGPSYGKCNCVGYNYCMPSEGQAQIYQFLQ